MLSKLLAFMGFRSLSRIVLAPASTQRVTAVPGVTASSHVSVLFVFISVHDDVNLIRWIKEVNSLDVIIILSQDLIRVRL